MEDPWETVLSRHIYSGLAYAQLDTDLRFVSVSDNFVALAQLDTSSIVPNTSLTTLFEEFIGVEEEILALTGHPDRSYPLNRINRPMISKNNKLVYVNLTVRPILPTNHFLFVLEDVTEEGELEQRLTQTRNELLLTAQKLEDTNRQLEKTNERLVKVNQLKSLFFSMIAHDLRAPLSIISGYANLLKNTLTTLQVTSAEYIETIRVNSRWLDNSINNMLDLHRIDNEQLRLERSIHDVVELVEETAAFFRPMVILNQQTLIVNLHDIPLCAYIDADRIKQLLQNLISNAIKYTEPNGTITISVNPTADNRKIEVTIEDTGSGMSPEQLRDIFNLYYRSPDAEKSEVKGTGIGLYIVKMLVEAHGGQVMAKSEVGKGSTFRFWLNQSDSA